MFFSSSYKSNSERPLFKPYSFFKGRGKTLSSLFFHRHLLLMATSSSRPSAPHPERPHLRGRESPGSPWWLMTVTARCGQRGHQLDGLLMTTVPPSPRTAALSACRWRSWRSFVGLSWICLIITTTEKITYLRGHRWSVNCLFFEGSWRWDHRGIVIRYLFINIFSRNLYKTFNPIENERI